MFGILGALGSIGGTAGGAAGSARQAQKQRKWQERMSNTAYQRMRKDLEAANLSPLLGMKTGGASTPSGGMASFHDMSGAASTAVSTAKQAKVARKELEASLLNLDEELGLGRKAGGFGGSIQARHQQTRMNRAITQANLDEAQNAAAQSGIKTTVDAAQAMAAIRAAQFEMQLFGMGVGGHKGVEQGLQVYDRFLNTGTELANLLPWARMGKGATALIDVLKKRVGSQPGPWAPDHVMPRQPLWQRAGTTPSTPGSVPRPGRPQHDNRTLRTRPRTSKRR